MKMPLQAKCLSMLSDGYAGRVIDAALAAINADMVERGDDGKPRKLVLTLTFTPEGSGQTDVEIDVQTKVPALKPPKTIAKYDHAAGGLLFNPDCRDNPEQMTFNDLRDKE